MLDNQWLLLLLREARKKSGKIACSTPYTRKALFFAFLPRKIVRFIFLGVRNDEVRVSPFVIISTKLLYFFAPLGLMAFLFFVLSFVALGYSYQPKESLLDEEADEEIRPAAVVAQREKTAAQQAVAAHGVASPGVASPDEAAPSDASRANASHAGTTPDNTTSDSASPHNSATSDSASPADAAHAADQAEETQTASLMPEDRRKQIQQRLDEWCAAMGYKDRGVNLLSLSHAIHISKDELTLFFDQSLKTTFRIWLSDIRFAAAKKMMIANPDYSNDIISSECGFTSRTHLYRIFKAREACTPTVWRERYLAKDHDSDASLS